MVTRIRDTVSDYPRLILRYANGNEVTMRPLTASEDEARALWLNAIAEHMERGYTHVYLSETTGQLRRGKSVIDVELVVPR